MNISNKTGKFAFFSFTKPLKTWPNSNFTKNPRKLKITNDSKETGLYMTAQLNLVLLTAKHTGHQVHHDHGHAKCNTYKYSCLCGSHLAVL